MVRLPPLERIGPHGPLRVERTIKLLPVGAISITVRVPFAVRDLKELLDFHDLQFSNGSLHDEVRQQANDARRELEDWCTRPVQQIGEEEAFTVFCIESELRAQDGNALSTEAWFRENRSDVARLLTQESGSYPLSEQESNESTDRYLSYYQRDLVVIDWDAALVIDDKRNFDETLYAMELANLQLAELEAYDRLLDDALERSYRDLGPQPLRRRGDVLRELREIRVDLARFSDELSNITKFFGDWHVARVYEYISARFHLSDWHRTIDEKLKTLDDLYRLLQHDQTNRWMLILETTIVLLFIIDLIILAVGLKHS
jgi:hypothetical protein